MCGFEYQELLDDRIITVLGTPGYNASVPPSSGSVRSLSMQGVTLRRPWYAGDGATFSEPGANGYTVHFQMFKVTNNTFNDGAAYGVSRSGAEMITVGVEDTTGLPTIRVNGAVVATGATLSFSAGQWRRVMLRVDQIVAGLVEVFFDGNLLTPVVTYTLAAFDISGLPGKPNEFWLKGPAIGIDLIDDIVAIDDQAPGLVDESQLGLSSIKPQVPIGAGADTGWTGTFADIDEVPSNDADSISVAAINTRSNFTHSAIAEADVLAVQLLARVIRSGTVAGANMQTYQTESATDEDQTTQTAPLDGRVSTIFQEKRGGGAWTAADYDNTTFGFVSRT